MKKIFARAIAEVITTSMVFSGCSLQRISEKDCRYRQVAF